jgi:hypothetical protein
MIPLFAGAKIWVPLGITVAIFAAGTGIGYKLADKRYRNLLQEVTQAKLDQQIELTKQLEQANARSAEASSAYQEAIAQLKTRVRTITKEVIREVEKPVYRCELPDSGRVLLDDAIRAANTAGGADDSVPEDSQPPP